MRRMRSHSAVIDHKQVAMLAEQLGVSVHTVRSWKQRDSIPAEYWAALETRGVATLEELAEAAAKRPKPNERGSTQ